jgi:hypothetical protein
MELRYRNYPQIANSFIISALQYSLSWRERVLESRTKDGEIHTVKMADPCPKVGNRRKMEDVVDKTCTEQEITCKSQYKNVVGVSWVFYRPHFL